VARLRDEMAQFEDLTAQLEDLVAQMGISLHNRVYGGTFATKNCRWFYWK
jgi:hypothetical protein